MDLDDKRTCHSRESGNPDPSFVAFWIPAFAGMTTKFYRFEKKIFSK